MLAYACLDDDVHLNLAKEWFMPRKASHVIRAMREVKIKCVFLRETFLHLDNSDFTGFLKCVECVAYAIKKSCKLLNHQIILTGLIIYFADLCNIDLMF